METIEGVPIVTFPRPPIWLVFKRSQIQQSQYHLVNFSSSISMKYACAERWNKLGKQNIHVMAGAIAEPMANIPHTVEPEEKATPDVTCQYVRGFEGLLEGQRLRSGSHHAVIPCCGNWKPPAWVRRKLSPTIVAVYCGYRIWIIPSWRC